MNKAIVFTAILIIAVAGLNAVDGLSKANAELTDILYQQENGDEKISIYVIMRDQYDSDELYNRVRHLPRPLRREITVNTLIDYSNKTQADIRQVLERMAEEGHISKLRYIWITNIIGMEADFKAIQEIDRLDEVAEIVYDPLEDLLSADWLNVDSDKKTGKRGANNRDGNDYLVRNPAGNVTRVRAPQVWEQGYRGEGAVVAVLDTGVNYNHRDLVEQMWTHPDYPNHGYNFAGDNNDPMDDNGHGSHCAGTVAGDGTSGTQTGVAPAASIMALKVLTRQGQGTVQSTANAIQFAVQNGADILSLSLGWRNAPVSSRATLRTAMVNAMNAGVIASVAVGNEGTQQNIPNNVRTPGNCPPPWLHPDQTLTGGLSAVVSVGATDNNDRIASFSSRGPVTWQNVSPFNDYAYNPGIGLITPDIVAPGVNVRSLAHNSNTGYRTTSGTSMAAPAVAGVMALMLSKDAGLTPEEMAQIIEESAISLSETKSNTFGSGRIDALNAIEAVVGTNPPNPAVRPSPAGGTEFIGRRPRLEWFNGGGARAYNVYLGTDNPPTNTVNGANTEERYYQVTTDLEPQRTYYWRIDSVNDNGVREGNVWTFETSAPNAVSSPEPANQATDIRMLPLLRWIEEGGAESFNVYLGTDNPPTNVLNGVESDETSYQITEDLETETVHYWRVDAVNVNGVTAGEVWSFTTGLPAGEGFETGDFSANPWQLYYAGNIEAYWYVDDEESFSGQFSARSGAIGNNGTTTLAITLELYEPGTISFARKVSSAADDFLVFRIDNEDIASWSGEVEWDEVTIPVPAGTRTLRWEYRKSPAGSTGRDAAWIDHITFPAISVPPTLPSPPVNVSSTAKLGHINIRWDLPQERPVILGYNIYRSVGTDAFHRINEELHRSNNFRDAIVEADTFYYYVKAVFENGESDPSQQTVIAINEAVSSPSFSHEGGEYNEPIELALTGEEDDVVIYYTIDNSEPTENSLLYEKPILLDMSTTVKARSFKLGHVPSEIVEAEYIMTLAAEQEFSGHNEIGLSVYPNPSIIGGRSGSVNIAFSLPGQKQVDVRIYNIKGQLVRNMGSHRNDGGKSNLSWDLFDNEGRVVGTGVYLINLKANDQIITKRVMIVN